MTAVPLSSDGAHTPGRLLTGSPARAELPVLSPELLSGAVVRPPSSRPAWATLFRIDRAVGSNSLDSGTDAEPGPASRLLIDGIRLGFGSVMVLAVAGLGRHRPARTVKTVLARPLRVTRYT